MVAVSNTSPLRYLVAVGHANLLTRLFQTVLIPPGVVIELTDPATPDSVRQWMASPPPWLQIRPLTAAPDTELAALLDQGEREAIQVAVESRADVLIMDEWKGRSIALGRGVPLIGALGVLGESYRQRFIDNPIRILAEMRRQGFRISDELEQQFQVLIRTRYARETRSL